ncbi:FtsK/SpoIIIE domain-containing protein [Iningainema tapete]|uniref:FtsK domain-containing protein n=1 Tax=Iningainema tapete BLCC-T55 TaxID=2748662 RepID=A0A8J7C7Z1_9CYAN|nr:FtsK/SpoIIIE domain-containing protein [Iningainema tapete]MBD2776354.1 hypothetical protein [Iningainema tapete BLCC-T55]
MAQTFSLYFQAIELQNLNFSRFTKRYGTQAHKVVIDSQRDLLLHLIGLSNVNNFTLSIRYFHNPEESSEQQLKLYIIANYSANDSYDLQQARDEIASFFEVGSLSAFYKFELLQKELSRIPELKWVNHIGEVIKPEKFNLQGYYLPYLFEANKDNNMLAVCDVLHRLKEKFLLEITLQVCQSSEDRETLVNALGQMVAQIQLLKSKSKNAFLDTALKTYTQYQESYVNRNLFKYNIKALAVTRNNIRTVLMTLVQSATKSNSYGEQDYIEIVSRDRDEQKFLESLSATENIEISTAVERNGWKGDFGEKYIREPIQPKLSNELGDGSTNIYSSPFNPANFSHTALPSSGGAIIQTGNSAITQSTNALKKLPLAQIKDLKPLHRLATLEEISGFFRLVIPGDTPVPGMATTGLHKSTVEEIFNSYSHLITKDEYIVGLDDDGNPVTSSWSEIPHRLVAGVSGAGKSNFLKWIIFQFLYVNPKRRIYIADFGGVDFQWLNHMGVNVEIETTPENCPNLVEKIHREEYERRLQLMQEYGVSNLKELQDEGVEIDRTLWIIDEAADIADVSSKLRDTIEKRLKEYARKGRKYGIHVIYCTQRPTTEVITKQVTDQCEEKVVFRVSPDASYRILEDAIAGDIPKDAIGRAYLNGSAGQMFVNTPFIKMPSGSKVKLSDTLWANLLAN